jgi:hypothetical protein
MFHRKNRSQRSLVIHSFLVTLLRGQFRAHHLCPLKKKQVQAKIIRIECFNGSCGELSLCVCERERERERESLPFSCINERPLTSGDILANP